MKYKIEKNIPVPAYTGGNKCSKWNFVLSLDDGDSFVIDEKNRGAFYQWSRTKKLKVITRLCKYDGISRKVRIWVYPQK